MDLNKRAVIDTHRHICGPKLCGGPVDFEQLRSRKGHARKFADTARLCPAAFVGAGAPANDRSARTW
jgi:hypothetical protein